MCVCLSVCLCVCVCVCVCACVCVCVCVCPYNICGEASAHLYGEQQSNRVSKSCLIAKLCFHRFVHFGCVPIYIVGFHHRHCASD